MEDSITITALSFSKIITPEIRIDFATKLGPENSVLSLKGKVWLTILFRAI